MIPEQRNPDWNWIKRDKQSIVKTSRFASPTFHRSRPVLLFSIALLRLFPFFSFLFCFFVFDVGGCEERPPLFMGTSDSSRSPCLPFAIGSTKTNDRSSLPCFTTAPAISVASLFIVDARYNSDSESPDESTTLSGVYIYICKIDAPRLDRRFCDDRAWITRVTWGGPCVYASRFYTYRLWRLPVGPIHGLGIREIRTQLANCRPRIRRWNSIERNAITVFLPGREGMEAGGDPISEILRARFDTTRGCSLP